ncbi:MAG: GNAT family N-acetyltransferase [Ignavibacterium sp.]|nr:GNAT family N-acetyltransferase [Ignavibacterium sp.]
MQDIIAPVDKKLIEKELSQNRFLRKTNNADNEIYVINFHNSPNVMREIGRLREVSFRTAGGGTGKDCDIDDYDTAEAPYEQLIVWDPDEKEIIGGYRFILCKNAKFKAPNVPYIATAGLFEFSEKFINEYFPYTIELGRSFVQPNYQSARVSRKSLYSLDNLWDGLGALVVNNPDAKYFFGKVTMYTTFNPIARDMILFFMNKFFPDKDRMIYPKKPLGFKTDVASFDKLFSAESIDENHKILFREVRSFNENIPPLFNSYMNLSPTMKTFGTAINDTFGGVEETGIMITISDIYDIKKERHVKY